MSLGLGLMVLVLNLSTNCYALENNTKKIPGTITSGDIVPGQPASLDPNKTWVLVNTKEPVVCFTETDGKQMVVPLENTDEYQTEINLLKQGNEELEKQINLLKETNKLQKEQLDISRQTIDSYKELIKSQKEAYEKQIENIKPSLFEKFSGILGGVGVGILVGLLL